MKPNEHAALKERIAEARTCDCDECRGLVVLADLAEAARKWRDGIYARRRTFERYTFIDEENLARAVDALATRSAASDSAPPGAESSESDR